ncbi:MAG TPA: HD domain-containing phosphohydrolase [Gemmatimonadaceae bacterium]|nr:HD domain-containing phosphohydrolase [Gemmatimonadaceae bacterium]
MADFPPLVIVPSRPSAELLGEGRVHDRAGRMGEAAASYEAAAAAAELEGAHRVRAEALRLLGVVHHRRHDGARARELCRASLGAAEAIGDELLAAEALNTLAGFDLESGDLGAARSLFHRALALAGGDASLRARIEQNLGILANIQGNLGAALSHYQRSLDAFHAAGNDRGRAIVHNNLGMVNADLGRWEDADRHLRQSLHMADSVGDVHLRGHALLNLTEVYLAGRRYDEARRNAEEALRIFDQIGARRNKSDAYRVLGMVYRETGRAALAESRLRAAIELAADADGILEEAEAARELARLYQDQGRNQDALRLLNRAHRLFRRLDARRDLVAVSAKVHELEGVYLAVVHDWGQSIESADSYTYGHCARVAEFALSVARGLGLDETDLTTIRLGAYLHDVGKVRIPHEILNKPGRLTSEEFAIMQMHPVYGAELLAGIDFPWDIKPIIRWHHEKVDGSGYPDRLRGDEIPLSAQIICVADVYDALTTTRSYRAAMTADEALADMMACRHWWRADVFEAFLEHIAAPAAAGARPLAPEAPRLRRHA